MFLEPAQLVAGWPWAVTVAAVGARGLLAGRRRAELNEALHELRRPLQALVLVAPRSTGAGRAGGAGIESSVQMAAAALERLDREINGGAAATVRAPLEVGSLLEAAVARWQRRATLGGGSLRLRCALPAVTVCGNRGELSQALDNLIVNAIEHGGPEVVVAAAPEPGGLRLSVTDSGRVARVRGGGRVRPTELLAKAGGRTRHGHGLRVVRRVASAHGGSFRLRHSEAGTEATLRLPMLDGDRA